ncbi:hypothetical protein [Marinobacter sp. LN3S78]|uniref:hypothetical protein n=1 Tax=Marinobacter sp. LN3S78 TaxID=3382300 RepID=UPI00387A98F6
MDAKSILWDLLCRLSRPAMEDASVIQWAAPVISFGDVFSSRVATLGLNPSNREFVNAQGEELLGDDRRFHTLTSLGLDRWSQADDGHLEKILDACRGYFHGNPYDSWFKALERLFVDAGASYYGMFANACHLDLVPYATAAKWGALSNTQRSSLIRESGDVLGVLLRESEVEVIVLNGQSVIENLKAVAECSFRKVPVQDWMLPRKNSRGVEGFAYTGRLTRISGIDLGREVSLLGYNHNLQSSFGVTSKVRQGIQKWISTSAMEVFC